MKQIITQYRGASRKG